MPYLDSGLLFSSARILVLEPSPATRLYERQILDAIGEHEVVDVEYEDISDSCHNDEYNHGQQ